MAAPPPANVPLQNLPGVATHNQQQPNVPPAPRPAQQQSRRPPGWTSKVEWLKVANALTMILLAAAGLAIAFVFGKLAEKKDSQNLKATLWRDCIDLADQIGDTQTCRKLLAGGFDSLSSKRRIRRQLSAPVWYESDTGTVNFVRELGSLQEEVFLRPLVYVTLTYAEFCYGLLIYYSFVATFFVLYLSSVVFEERRSISIDYLCIVLGLGANEYLHSLVAPQNSYFVGSGIIHSLFYTWWFTTFVMGTTPFLNIAASAMRTQSPGSAWPSLRFVELFFWTIIIHAWPSTKLLDNKAEIVEIVVRLLGPIFASFMITLSLVFILMTLPISREMFALFYLWYMAEVCYFTEWIMSFGFQRPETRYPSYQRRARRQTDLVKQKLTGGTWIHGGELETPLSIILGSVTPYLERFADIWPGRKLGPRYSREIEDIGLTWNTIRRGM